MFENRGDKLTHSNNGDMNENPVMLSVMTWDGRLVHYGANADSYRGDLSAQIYYDDLDGMYANSDEKALKDRVMNPPLSKPPPAPNIHTKYYDDGEFHDGEINYDTNGGLHDIYLNIPIPSFNGDPPTLGDPPPAPTLPVLDDPAVFSYYIPGCGFVSRADQEKFVNTKRLYYDYSVKTFSDEIFLSLPIVKEVWNSESYTDYIHANGKRLTREAIRITVENFQTDRYKSFLSSAEASTAPLLPYGDSANSLQAADPDTVSELEYFIDDCSYYYPYRKRSWHQLLSPAEYGEINTRLAWICARVYGHSVLSDSLKWCIGFMSPLGVIKQPVRDNSFDIFQYVPSTYTLEGLIGDLSRYKSFLTSTTLYSEISTDDADSLGDEESESEFAVTSDGEQIITANEEESELGDANGEFVDENEKESESEIIAEYEEESESSDALNNSEFTDDESVSDDAETSESADEDESAESADEESFSTNDELEVENTVETINNSGEQTDRDGDIEDPKLDGICHGVPEAKDGQELIDTNSHIVEDGEETLKIVEDGEETLKNVKDGEETLKNVKDGEETLKIVDNTSNNDDGESPLAIIDNNNVDINSSIVSRISTHSNANVDNDCTNSAIDSNNSEDSTKNDVITKLKSACQIIEQQQVMIDSLLARLDKADLDDDVESIPDYNSTISVQSLFSQTESQVINSTGDESIEILFTYDDDTDLASKVIDDDNNDTDSKFIDDDDNKSNTSVDDNSTNHSTIHFVTPHKSTSDLTTKDITNELFATALIDTATHKVLSTVTDELVPDDVFDALIEKPLAKVNDEANDDDLVDDPLVIFDLIHEFFLNDDADIIFDTLLESELVDIALELRGNKNAPLTHKFPGESLDSLPILQSNLKSVENTATQAVPSTHDFEYSAIDHCILNNSDTYHNSTPTDGMIYKRMNSDTDYFTNATSNIAPHDIAFINSPNIDGETTDNDFSKIKINGSNTFDINVSDTVCYSTIPEFHNLLCTGDIGKINGLLSDGDSKFACNGYLNSNDTLNSNAISTAGYDDLHYYLRIDNYYKIRYDDEPYEHYHDGYQPRPPPKPP